MTNRRPQLVDPFIPRPATKPAVAEPEVVAPRTAAKTGNIDGIMPGKKPLASAASAKSVSDTAPARPQRVVNDVAAPVKQHKPHLQPHPLLQRKPQTMDVRPPRPVGSARQPGAIAATRNIEKGRLNPQAEPKPVDKAAKKGNGSGKDRPQPQLRHHWNLGRMTIFGIVLGGIFGFLSFFSLQLGQIVIAIYAVIVLWKRLPSRVTFMLALIMFGGIILTQLLTPDSGVSENLAVYAFLLLCVGTMSLFREVRHDGLTGKAGSS